MRIIDVDLRDDAQATAVARLRHAEAIENVGVEAALDSAAEVSRLRHRVPGREFVYALAVDDPGRIEFPHGVATVTWETTHGNDDVVSIDVFVDARHRCAGTGTALLRHALNLAPTQAARVWGNIITPGALPPDHPVRRWAERRGLRVTSVAHDLLQEWPVDRHVLDELDPGEPAGYRAQCFVDGVPEGLRDQMGRLSGMVTAEAPTGDRVVHPVERSAEEYTTALDDLLAGGGHRIEAVALAENGEVAGYSSLDVPSIPEAPIEVGGTLVLPEHRGHRLGLVLKCAVERRALELDLPQRSVWTSTDDSNTHMLAINRALGFRTDALVADLEGSRSDVLAHTDGVALPAHS